MLASVVLVALLNQVPSAKFTCPIDAERKIEQRADATVVYCEGPDLMGGTAKNGPYLELRPDKSTRWVGSYLNDRPDGTWRRYDRAKNVVERREYRNGRLISKTFEGGGRVQGGGGPEPGFDGEDLSDFEGPEGDEDDEGAGVGPEGAFRDARTTGGIRTRTQLDPSDFAARHYGFINSVGGLVKGDSVFGVGGTLFYFVPMLDLRYRYGVADPLAFDVRLSTFGIYNRLNLGLRTRVVGNETVSLFLDTKLGLNAIFFPGDFFLSTNGMDLAGVPGLGLSFGGPEFQFSLGVQVPIVFFTFITSGGSDLSITEASPLIRPFLGIDAAIGQRTSLYALVELETSLDEASSTSLTAAEILVFTSLGVAFDFNRRRRIY